MIRSNNLGWWIFTNEMFMSAFITFRPFLEERISVLCVGPEIANKNVAYQLIDWWLLCSFFISGRFWLKQLLNNRFAQSNGQWPSSFTVLYVMADFFQNVLLDEKIDFHYLIESWHFWKRFYIGEVGARFFAFFVHLNSALSKFLTSFLYWSDAN